MGQAALLDKVLACLFYAQARVWKFAADAARGPRGEWGDNMGETIKEIRISVRNLVEFVMRSGDIDNRYTGGADRAMQEGSRIHRKIQKGMGAEYQAEVPMKCVAENDGYRIVVEGRADGVIRKPEETVIDEIKGMYLNVGRLEAPIPLHLAQAFCYGHMYCREYGLERISIQLTYCNLETEEIRRFRQDKSAEELNQWFEELIGRYRKWAEYLYIHERQREESLKALKFPYPYREGQKELAVSVYRAISQKKNLFIQAPTGLGKTLSTVYPALKAMGEGYGEKLFYLTARTITRSVAEECFALLQEQQLVFTSVTITAKEKLCPEEKNECNPDVCPWARGHFDRVNEAVFAIIHEKSVITREDVLFYARQYKVCPFEFCLDISSWADGIICDYNYVFDPKVRLKRFFTEGGRGEHLFLVDEAHNLVDRAREMYSAMLVKEDFLAVKRILKGHDHKVERGLERCNRNLLELKRECGSWKQWEEVNLFVVNLIELFGNMENLMEEEKEFADRDIVLDFYFAMRHFLNQYEHLDERYRIYTELGQDGFFRLHLFCVDPSVCLAQCLKKSISTIFFSATLLPVVYYKKLLSGNEEDYAVYSHSPFPQENRLILIGSDVSSRYTRRNIYEYGKVVDYLQAVAQSHRGNYLAFFPSYQYMEAIGRELEKRGDQSFIWKMQESRMGEEEREAFLTDFEVVRERSFMALCVLGGIFSEGIDLKDERLEGVIITGTGIPMVCARQEILKTYFDQQQENGYNYAYQYPGMNKVMQAAGRVIRTAHDRGVILLLDDRFLRTEIQELFPREWSEYGHVTRNTVSGWLKRFW